jgi:dTDP-4-amino-4,6-dideoxygalactose transaminase
MFHLICQDTHLLKAVLSNTNIQVNMHYQPLHSSILGEKYQRDFFNFTNTNLVSSSLVRFPIWIDMDVEKTVNAARQLFESFRFREQAEVL